MKKTKAERQATWRAKQRIKADMFDLSEEGRKLSLYYNERPKSNTPEWRVVREYFLAYPGCHRLPDDVGCTAYCDDDGKETIPALYATMDYYRSTEVEARVAYIALSSITSHYVSVEAVGDGKSAAWDRDDDETLRIRAEIDALKRAGMWRPFVGDLQRLNVTVLE